MKNIIYLLMLTIIFSCKAQTYPLRTYGIKIPQNAYLKDTNNELPSYEGTWKGTWNNKVIFLTLKKRNYVFTSTMLGYYADILIGKFKVTDNNGNVLFDNTNLSDAEAKIEGGRFRKKDGKYSLTYSDMDICGLNGFIQINFTDSTKTKLAWKFDEGDFIITKDCPYYSSPEFPQPLPKEIILTKQ